VGAHVGEEFERHGREGGGAPGRELRKLRFYSKLDGGNIELIQ
jgi:hypothetical protein